MHSFLILNNTLRKKSHDFLVHCWTFAVRALNLYTVFGLSSFKDPLNIVIFDSDTEGLKKTCCISISALSSAREGVW